jgi:hypothetical protein
MLDAVTRHYNKIKTRKGTKIATIAAARKMMRAIYHRIYHRMAILDHFTRHSRKSISGLMTFGRGSRSSN